jgi:NAD(P)-dependent dehydrogenase (short-subunit alcohol dehydrogenase family)
MSYLDNLYNVTGKVAVITGGAGLLGRRYADALAQAGAIPVIADVDGTLAEKLAREIEEKYRASARGFAVDITSKNSLEECKDRVIKEFGKVDVLINNAGISGKAEDATVAPGFEDYPLAEWEKAFAVNVTGMFLAAQVFGREMAKQERGVIVNVCSIYGILSPDQRIYEKAGAEKQFIKPVSYAVSKSAILNFTRYLATYWASKNIRVNTLTPGGVFDNQDADFVKKYSERTPMGRMANPEDMVGPMLFLVSDASAYMTGANIIVDGGWSAW